MQTAPEVAKELLEDLRTNNTLRHRLGIEDGPQLVDDQENVIAYTDKEGNDWFLEVQGS